MVSTRAVAASHPVGGSARRGIARAGSSADPAGFPAILAAASKTAGEPLVAAADDAPQQSGPANPLSARQEREGRQQKGETAAPEAAELAIPGRRKAPRAQAAVAYGTPPLTLPRRSLSSGRGSLPLPALQGEGWGEGLSVASTTFTCQSGYRTHNPILLPVGPAPGEFLSDGTSVDASEDAAASGGSAIGNGQAATPREGAATTANAGADPKNARRALVEHVAARAGTPVLPQAEAAARKPPPAPAEASPQSTERPLRSALHPIAAAVALPIMRAIAAIELSAEAIAAGGSPVAGRPGATAASTADPTERFSPRRDMSAGAVADSRSRTIPGPDQSVAADATGQIPEGNGTAALPAASEGAGDTVIGHADTPGPAAGSPASPPSDPAPALTAIAQKPSPPSAGSPSTPIHPAAPAFFAGPAADTANPSPAAGAGVAAQTKGAPDAPPPSLAEPLAGPMIGSAADGHHDLALRLHPSGLGAVDVRVVVTGRAVSAWFDSPQPQVQQAIAQNMGELQKDLAAAGYDLNGAWVGGETWTPRERTAGPALPRYSRNTGDSGSAQPARHAVSAATRSGVSVYV